MKVATLSHVRVALKLAQASAPTIPEVTKSSTLSQTPWPDGTLPSLQER